MHITSRLFFCSTASAMFALAPCAHALPEAAPGLVAVSHRDTPAPEQVLPSEPAADFVAGFGVAAKPQLLDSARGGNGGVASATLRASVSGNSASNVVTGANTIQASSFAGAVGIPIVIQNSGANVLIQNATVINLQLQ